jgi:hypothetical protein
MLYSRPSNYVGSQPNPLIGGCEGSHPILKCDDPGVDYEWIEGQRDSSVVYRLGPRGVQEYGIPPVGIGCVPHFQRNSNSNLHYIPYISGISQLYPHKNGWFMFVSYIQKVNHNSARTPYRVWTAVSLWVAATWVVTMWILKGLRLRFDSPSWWIFHGPVWLPEGIYPYHTHIGERSSIQQ